MLCLVADGDEYNTEPYALSNDGFTREMCVDREPQDENHAKKHSKENLNHVQNNNGSAMPASFVNPAFDKDDISDEELESSMAKPSSTRPRTLRKSVFCL